MLPACRQAGLPAGRQVSKLSYRDEKMVGADRFELSTSWSQTKRASQLRYAPIISYN